MESLTPTPEGGPFPSIEVDTWVSKVSEAELGQRNLGVVEEVFPQAEREQLSEALRGYVGLSSVELRTRLLSEFGGEKKLHAVEQRFASAQDVTEQYRIARSLPPGQRTGLFIFLRHQQRKEPPDA